MTGRLSLWSTAVGRYRSTLLTPGAVRFFGPAAVARLGVAMSRLAVLWAVQGAEGSFGQAGAATGALAVADAVAGPQIARLVDRWGQRRVMTFVTAAFVAAGIAIALGTATGWPAGATVMLSALAGASAPPVGALSAARWRAVTRTPQHVRAALSLEGSLNDATFLVGPVLVTTISATVASWSGLVLAVALVGVGMAGVLTASASEPRPAGRSRGLVMDRRLLGPQFLVLFVTNLAMGLFFGGIPVAVMAFALANGVGSLAGVVAAVGGVVSLVAGIVYGGLERGRPVVTMAVVSVVITVGTAMLSLVPTVPIMFVGYGVVGGGVALVLIPASVLLQRVTPRGAYT